MRNNHDAPEREFETIAFSYESAFHITTVPEKRKLFGLIPYTKKVQKLTVDPAVWHYLKELVVTNCYLSIVCLSQNKYLEALAMIPTMPEPFQECCPEPVLCPPDVLRAWCLRHRAFYVNANAMEDYDFLDRFIMVNGQPESN